MSKGKRGNLAVFLVTAGIFLASPPCFASSLEDLLGGEKAMELRAGKRPAAAGFKDPRPILTPNHSGLKALLESIRAGLEPSVMVETLYLYAKPAGAGQEWNKDQRNALFNKTLELSTLEGLQYYSASRGAMRTFYETSTVIDGPSSKKVLGDPVYSEPPLELTLYARQKDLTFGDNIYQYDYHTYPDALIFVQQNLTAMTAGIIPAVRKNRLRSTVAIFDAGDYLLVYAVSMAKAAALPGLKDRISNSFANRAEAVLSWFSGQADKAFAGS
jgi:hypothetical protein